MISVKQYMEIIDYKITEGSEYLWGCYGENARYMDSDNDDYSVSIIFDTANQCVYEAAAYDYRQDRAYRLFNPQFKDGMIAESLERDCPIIFAWDAVKFTDLETADDFITKASAIVSGIDYDTRVCVPVDLDDHELLKLMTIAHERDITLNQLVEEILVDVVDKNRGAVSPKIKSNKKRRKSSTKIKDGS
jgi:hypothetical protein